MPFRVTLISPLEASAADLERRQQRYGAVAGPDTAVTVQNLAGGPAALNSGGDVLTSAAAIFQQGSTLTRAETDALLVDCVFDPAVDELAEATGLPTFGPTRTTLPLINLVADSFSIIARSRRQCTLLAELVTRAGYGHALRATHALDISYAEAKQANIFSRVMADRLQTVATEDHAGAVLFGSTTMALTAAMRAAANHIPLFMPGMVTLRLMEQLWQDGLWPADA